MALMSRNRPAIDVERDRLALILNVERTALYARYVIYAIPAVLFLLKHIRGTMTDFLLVTLATACHNIFAHWVLYTGRYRLFRSPLNLAVYVAEIAFIVSVTGGPESDAYVLYILLIIGFGAYSRRFKQTFLLAILCSAVYTAIILADLFLAGTGISVAIITAKLMFILVAGWLVGRVSEVLRSTEQHYLAHADAFASAEAALRTILDSTADPILVYNEREVVIEANDKTCEFLGVSRDRLIGQRIGSFIFDDDTWPAKMAALRDRGHYRGEQIFIDFEGTERNVDFIVRSFIRDNQRLFVGVAHDITERKQLQEVTQLANVNLARLNRQLRQVSQLKSETLAAISGKLRSPLAAILGYVDMLLHEELGETTPEQRKALRTCRRCAVRLFRLMDESLALDTTQSPSTATPENTTPQ